MLILGKHSSSEESNENPLEMFFILENLIKIKYTRMCAKSPLSFFAFGKNS